MDINDQIFEAVKKNLENNSTEEQNLFVKICLGTATQEEKEEFNKICGEDIGDELNESCQIGHQMASQFDTGTKDKLDFIISELREIKEMLRSKEIEKE